MTSFPSSTLNFSFESSLPSIETLSSSSSSPSNVKSDNDDDVDDDTVDVAVTVVTPGSRSKSNLMSDIK
jgi:hypothetical protein